MRKKTKSGTKKRILKTKTVLKSLFQGELFQFFTGLHQMTEEKKLGFGLVVLKVTKVISQ